jgi:hypothetical protein
MAQLEELELMTEHRSRNDTRNTMKSFVSECISSQRAADSSAVLHMTELGEDPGPSKDS